MENSLATLQYLFSCAFHISFFVGLFLLARQQLISMNCTTAHVVGYQVANISKGNFKRYLNSC